MRSPIFSFLMFFAFTNLQAQFVEISLDEGYTQQVYYSFDDDRKTIVENEEWDIAFTGVDLNAAIHLNEATGLAEKQVELYQAPTKNFDTRINEDDLVDQIYNKDESWSVGAFNEIADSGNNLDYGWGFYNPTSHVVEGSSIYCLKLRDGTFKKLKIESLEGSIYNFKYANLDGSDEINTSVDMTNAPDGNFVYYSISNNREVRKAPSDWDLLFTRYITPLDDNTGTGGILDYAVSGVFSGIGVEVAQIDGEEPTMTGLPDDSKYLPNIDVIGFDWKDIDIENVIWTINPERTYYVKLPNGEIWRMHFIDFEGSSTGTMVFEKFEGNVASDHRAIGALTDVTVFPNPISTEAEVTFSLEKSEEISVIITSMLGQQVYQKKMRGQGGLNAISLSNLQMPSGNYVLTLMSASGKGMSTKLNIVK